MRKQLCLSSLILIFAAGFCFGQTFQTNGDWATASNWNPASVPSGAATDVTVSANPTISATHVIGHITDGNTVAYTINGTGNLSVGASGTAKNMTFNNSGSVSISSGGVLEIWGDLNVNNNLALTVVGTLTVHGNVNMNNNTTVTVTGGGGVTVGGDFTGQSNTHLSVSGSGSSVVIAGALSLGSGTSSIVATLGGTIKAASCSCSGCSLGFDCSAVPITLLSFKGTTSADGAVLNWTTLSEINFDYFVLERSASGIQFSEIARIKGVGFSNASKDYTYTDPNPFADNSYYRLTSIDLDGYTKVFNNNVVVVNSAAEKNFRVYPNPSTGNRLFGKVNFKTEQPGEVEVFNNLGIILATYRVDQPEFELLLPPIPNGGVFFVRFSSRELSMTRRVTVAK